MKLDCQGKDFTARMFDSFYAKVILYYRYKVNFLKRLFWNACLQHEFVIQDFYLPTGKITRKGHLNNLSNEYKIISVPKRIFSKKKNFNEHYALNFFPAKRGWMRKSY